jgi:hypothetical protein
MFIHLYVIYLAGFFMAELREMMDKYFKGDGEVLPSIMEAVLQRKLSRKHEETDDELMEELRMKPLSDVDAEEFQSDFDELYETDKELNDLCDAKEYVAKKMMQDQYFNMDDKKWDEMVKEAMDHGFIKDTKECEEILEDMLSWDKLLPGMMVLQFASFFFLLLFSTSCEFCYGVCLLFHSGSNLFVLLCAANCSHCIFSFWVFNCH